MLPTFPVCSASLWTFCSVPYSPTPLLPFFLLAVAPWQGWGAIDKLFKKKIFFKFPKLFQMPRRGQRNPATAERGGRGNMFKTFPSPTW